MMPAWNAPLVRDVSPAFARFLETRNRVQRDNANVKIWCETRIGRALDSHAPRTATTEALIHPKTGKVHRCDLAKLWVAMRQLDERFADRTLISSGVRHSLSVIFKAFNGDTFALPSDVYPVYWSLAQSAQVATAAYETFPAPVFESAVFQGGFGSPRFALVCNPLKLQGRELSGDEVMQLRAWLQSDGNRRLIVDGVYANGCSVPSSTRDLLQTHQVWLLDSMSKSWLTENVLGVVVVPPGDLPALKPAFAALELGQESLRIASALLMRHANYPNELADKLRELRDTRLAEMQAIGVPFISPVSGYFIPCKMGAEALLEKHGVLALPLEVFGSRQANWSAISALPVVGAK